MAIREAVARSLSVAHHTCLNDVGRTAIGLCHCAFERSTEAMSIGHLTTTRAVHSSNTVRHGRLAQKIVVVTSVCGQETR